MGRRRGLRWLISGALTPPASAGGVLEPSVDFCSSEIEVRPASAGYVRFEDEVI